MELEAALNEEVERLEVLADAAARRIAAGLPWWAAALALLRKAVRECR
jgi:hypothetical protein